MARNTRTRWFALASALAMGCVCGCGTGNVAGVGGSGGTTEGGAGASGMGGGGAGGSAGASATCGNGTVEPGEQCDDGNVKNLDGCDSTCHYEAILRMTQVAISGNQAPAACTPNTNYFGRTVLGRNLAAFGVVRDQINTPLQDSLNNGTSNVLVQLLNMNDQKALDGLSGSGLSLGFLNADLDPKKGTWTGSTSSNQPIDWWFTVSGGLDSSDRPAAPLAGATLNNYALTAGPGIVSVTFAIGGSAEALTLADARVFGTFASASNQPAPPPNANQLASNLSVFETFQATADGTQGLCGNLTVPSLAAAPLPPPPPGGIDIGALCGYTDCQSGQSPTSTSCNSLLDLIVGGCTISSAIVIPASQPDVKNGGPTLAPDATTKKVPTSQVSGDNDAYSAYLTFAGNRAHATNNL